MKLILSSVFVAFLFVAYLADSAQGRYDSSQSQVETQSSKTSPKLAVRSNQGSADAIPHTVRGSSDAVPAPIRPKITSKEFLRLDSGVDLTALTVKGRRFKLVRGVGKTFGAREQQEYRILKSQALKKDYFPVQWVLQDLDSGKVISESRNPDMNFYGASVSKVYVAAGLLQEQNGQMSRDQMNQMARMIVVSDNRAWRNLQKDIGQGSDYQGQAKLDQFIKSLGLTNTRPYRGWYQNLHGNETNARDLVKFMEQTYRKQYEGASTVWKMMYGCRTGARKALAYMPSNIYVGGKTGTYHGQTVNAHTQRGYRAKVHHHLLTFQHEGRQYAMAILSDRGSDRDVALIAGGLVDEYLK